jgi:hypothetical protein
MALCVVCGESQWFLPQCAVCEGSLCRKHAFRLFDHWEKNKIQTMILCEKSGKEWLAGKKQEMSNVYFGDTAPWSNQCMYCGPEAEVRVYGHLHKMKFLNEEAHVLAVGISCTKCLRVYFERYYRYSGDEFDQTVIPGFNGPSFSEVGRW